MKKMVGISAALVAVLMLAGSASAQGKKGKGKGGFAFGPLGLLSNKDVQKDMKLSDEQVTKVKDLVAKQTEAFKELKGLDKEEAFQKMKEIMADTTKAIDDLLTADQTKRMKQLQLQQSGAMAFFNPKLAESLDLSDEQKEKITETLKESFVKRKEIAKGFKEDPKGTQKKLAEFNKALMADVVKVLNDDQKSKFKEMQGAPFKGTLPPGFGGFGGFFGGGGGGATLQAIPPKRRTIL